jgi:ferredoxin
MTVVVTVKISDPEASVVVETEAEPDESLMDLVDRLGAPISLACRAANCASCLVWIDEGEAALSPPGPDERAVLSLFGAHEAARLACQAVVVAREGRVALRVLGRPKGSPPAGAP